MSKTVLIRYYLKLEQWVGRFKLKCIIVLATKKLIIVLYHRRPKECSMKICSSSKQLETTTLVQIQLLVDTFRFQKLLEKLSTGRVICSIFE
jgi:hypothetical protein